MYLVIVSSVTRSMGLLDSEVTSDSRFRIGYGTSFTGTSLRMTIWGVVVIMGAPGYIEGVISTWTR